MWDCRNGPPEAHNEDLTECRGMIQHEVGKKNPKREKFHETVSPQSSIPFKNQPFLMIS